MSVSPSIVWFRRDFRLSDHPALRAAIDRGGAVIPVYIHAPEEAHPWEPGEASNWWRHKSLQLLDESLRQLGSRLILRRGGSLAELKLLLRETGAEAVFYNRLYEPARIEYDKEIKQTLKAEGICVKSFNGALLNEPWEITSKSGTPFKVFTPFWRNVTTTTTPSAPLPKPSTLAVPADWPKSVSLDSLALHPKLDWWKGLDSAWHVGEQAAIKRLNQFLESPVQDYGTQRDVPSVDGTGRISPHLHFGEITPRIVYQAVRNHYGEVESAPAGVSKFLAEIGWREFAHHLLGTIPTMDAEPINGKFKHFPWEENPEGLAAWQKGNTGFPIVDAGMRQLYETGWMHNRVRMIVGSFLVKDLRVHWSYGARWFWNTLVDADLAANSMGWQWVAGCGADAAPYFRVFNPMTQGEKFDPEGKYLKRFVPELSAVPKQYIHQPWELPGAFNIGGSAVAKNFKLGRDYPKPIVDHGEERLKALAAYSKIKA